MATLLDEAASWAVMKETERVAPSFELDCRFRRPVPLGVEIEVRGQLLRIRHNIAFSKAEVVTLNDELLAAAEVKSKLLSSEVA